ncbi:MAG: hypothetical protein CVU42_10410 [Chloroflexi bacterium HGW-Chloroflexi-4]|jgi:hypothetical protein|nr:MAG: hypothetical protein CVU42_10410 [Chloroflexi bacterium HGW-Chloroflexi-4]
MKNIQKMGGIGSLIGAATNLFALVVFATVLVPNGDGSDYIAFLADNQSFMRALDMIIYLVFGVGILLLSLALNERLKAGSPSLVYPLTSFGLIYAVLVIVVGTLSISSMTTAVNLYGANPTQAATVWLALESVGKGLGGGGGETMISGLWILFLSYVALQAREFPRMLNYFGLMVGVSGILSVFFPWFLGIAVLYGLGLISWLAWLGIVMLRNTPILSRSPSQA